MLNELNSGIYVDFGFKSTSWNKILDEFNFMFSVTATTATMQTTDFIDIIFTGKMASGDFALSSFPVPVDFQVDYTRKRRIVSFFR